MNQHFTVNSVSAAWAKANEVFPSDYVRDDRSSKNAGYNIYRSSVQAEDGVYQWHYCYICDLGNCLEVNLTDHKWDSTTIYINIDCTAAGEFPPEAEKQESPKISALVLTEEEVWLIRSAICRKSMQNTTKLIEARHENEEIMSEFYATQRMIYHSIINKLDIILGFEESFPDEEKLRK